MKLWPTKKTPCPHHGRQGAKLGGPDVRRRRQRGAPSAVESQCSSRQAPAAIPASRSGWALCSCGLRLYRCSTQVRPIDIWAKLFTAHHSASLTINGDRQLFSAILAVDDVSKMPECRFAAHG